MIWFICIMGVIFVSLFILGIWVEKINQRRERDPEYDSKITRIIEKTDPYYNFVFNLSGWIFAILVIYFIYLG